MFAILNSVENILKEILEVEQDIDLNEDLSSIGLDSLVSVSLIVELEEKFGITFDDDELIFENFSNIKKIIDIVESKMN
ncbi:acyl carrier protein [Bacillus cereus]|nr:acyl carrier protein [Bacillus cereus]